ncbi:hypothetical protein [Rummeliibacillus suwonensis]|uniref:hypothetical protein n=1 Tax=Rummeliibacillus suwonensis TaxID=1306154 RepID=UPI001AAFB80D|nr:hypothetical protein [Rummeliibacillus suwonensis]MBO2537013.1 hypothetical protein [Rummeliibacillus suwonensis]
MGTSKSNISKKVKDILKDKPISELKNMAPEVTKKVLSKRTINSQLIEENRIFNSINLIVTKINNISNVGGFNGKTKEELLNDKVTLEEFLNMILDQIEENGFLNKTLLEKAYKIAMTECLKLDEIDINIFSKLLFYHLIKQILYKDLYDTLKNIYPDFPYEKINQIIENVANQIINNSVYSLIEQFVAKKIPLSDVINRIVSETSHATFGEF